MQKLLGYLQEKQDRNIFPHEIIVNVVVNLQQDNLHLQLDIDPESPFNVLVNDIIQFIYVKMQAQYEETIECQLGNGSNLLQSDARTLQELGFTNNCTLYMRLKLLHGNKQEKQDRNDEAHAISVNVVVNLQKANLNLQFFINPECPFNILVNGIKEQIFAQRMQAQYEEIIECQLGNGSNLLQSDARTLQELGFTNNCTLNMRLKLLGSHYINQKKKIYKVLVDLEFKKIELFIEQCKSNPVSCLFHDILIELFNNQQLKIARPFAFFINQTEINPFDIRQIQDFETSKGILVRTILPNKEANKNSMEKFQFAFNSSKLIKPCLRKIIKIEYNNDTEIFAYNDKSLQKIIQDICEDLIIYPNYSINCIINEEQLQNFQLEKVYAIKDIKVNIQNKNDTEGIAVFKVIGDFYKKFQIEGFINGIEYFIEEFMSMNTSMKEFLEHVKFKIFGPKQIDYKQNISEYSDFEARVIYEKYEK